MQILHHQEGSPVVLMCGHHDLVLEHPDRAIVQRAQRQDSRSRPIERVDDHASKAVASEFVDTGA